MSSFTDRSAGSSVSVDPSCGGLTLYPIHYGAALACSLIPPPLPHQRPLQSAFPRGETTGLLRSSSRSLRGEVVPFGRWRIIRDRGQCSPCTRPHTFFGSSLTASLACLCLRPLS